MNFFQKSHIVFKETNYIAATGIGQPLFAKSQKKVLLFKDIFRTPYCMKKPLLTLLNDIPNSLVSIPYAEMVKDDF